MKKSSGPLAGANVGEVVCEPGTWQVTVRPGEVRAEDGRTVRIDSEHVLAIRPGGRRAYRRQRYAIVGEARKSPCFWNGEDIRGSGGMPCQRMVPGSLRVYDEHRSAPYAPDEDYGYDYYWGTIKRHPQGRIGERELLLLDYDVWLCRYDAIVLQEDGTIAVVEGAEEAPESRELLLPDPPVVKRGIVLAHVFTGWGEASLYDGSVAITLEDGEWPPGDVSLPNVTGRYLDAAPRDYRVEIVALSPDDDSLSIIVSAEGIDYGRERMLTEETLRWSAPVTFSRKEPAPLAIVSEYGHAVDWGLSLDFGGLEPDAGWVGARFRIAARPHSVLNLTASSADAADAIPVLNREALEPFRRKLLAGGPARIAFYGESTTRSGRWPYQLMRFLRRAYPDAALYSSNVAIGGESSVRGARRYEHEVRSTAPDLVVLEYMLNDSGCLEAPKPAMREILVKLRRDGIPCLIVTNNGMNPLFCGSMRAVEASHELYRRAAEEFDCAFVGGFRYFERLHAFGVYFPTTLKGNMVNHSVRQRGPRLGELRRSAGTGGHSGHRPVTGALKIGTIGLRSLRSRRPFLCRTE